VDWVADLGNVLQLPEGGGVLAQKFNRRTALESTTKLSKTHATNVVQAAREIIQFVGGQAKIQDNLIHFEVRIGVHTGPVVAGIVGTKKWQYDIWGDTVNIASRMESMSESGRVNLSETTYQHIKDEFLCEYRGLLDVKNRGALKMYFIA
jgi:class 3 adenylate cyclase